MNRSFVYMAVILCSVLGRMPDAAGAPEPAALPGSVSGQVLEVRGNKDFAPFEFLNATGRPDGYSVELMQAVAKAAALKIRLQMGTWPDVFEELKAGRIDILTGVLYSRERDRVFDFSIPVTVLSYSIFVRRDSGIDTIEDLQGKEVVTVRGVYAHEVLENHPFVGKLVPVDSPEEALQRVSIGQSEVAVLVRLHGLELMRRMRLKNLQTIGPPVLTQKFCMAVRSGNSDLLARLNEGLFRLQAEGEYDRIYLKWFSVYEQTKLLGRLLHFGKLSLLPLLGAAAALILWIWTLKRVVRHRTRELKNSEKRFRSILEGTPLPTVVVAADGRLSHWNRACERVTGISAARAFDDNRVRDHRPDADRPALVRVLEKSTAGKNAGGVVIRRLRETCENGGFVHLEVFIPFLGPRGRWLYGTLAPYLDAEGQRAGSIETWTDFTERRELERKLVHSRKMESLGNMARAVAHDFSTFLQVIVGYAFSLRDDIPVSSPARQDLKGIDETVYKAKELIRQIMTFASRNLSEARPVQVRHAVESSLKMLTATAPNRVEVQIRLNSEAWIMADEVQIGRVVMNLGANAFQAMAETGGRLEVALGDVFFQEETLSDGLPALEGKYVRLTVTDTGPGIDAENQDRIFEPFFSTRKREGGNGMGLAIVHGIVTGYGGRITLTTAPGKGTTFEVFWPAVEEPGKLSQKAD